MSINIIDTIEIRLALHNRYITVTFRYFSAMITRKIPVASPHSRDYPATLSTPRQRSDVQDPVDQRINYY